jgi:hypothetical protein
VGMWTVFQLLSNTSTRPLWKSVAEGQVDKPVQRFLQVIIVRRKRAQRLGEKDLVAFDAVDALAQFSPLAATPLPFRIGGQCCCLSLVAHATPA